MMTTLLKDIKLGHVVVEAWVKSITKVGKTTFLILRDGIGENSQVQVYVPPRLLKKPIAIESYVKITGIVTQLPEGKFSFRPFELQAKEIEVLGESHNEFSSRCPDDCGRDIKLDQRHLVPT